jgi:RNA:NAD 2'-phosphotransferase (TPT1/KptA family)
MWYIYITEYFWTIKRNKVLIHGTTRKNLEKLMESEISQTQKTTCHIILFLGNARIGKSMDAK